MQCKLVYLGDSIERWEVSRGESLMYFQNDRPERMASKSNRVVKWQMIKGLEYIKDPVKAAQVLTDIWDKIEMKSGARKPTFEEVRNKK